MNCNPVENPEWVPSTQNLIDESAIGQTDRLTYTKNHSSSFNPNKTLDQREQLTRDILKSGRKVFSPDFCIETAGLSITQLSPKLTMIKTKQRNTAAPGMRRKKHQQLQVTELDLIPHGPDKNLPNDLSQLSKRERTIIEMDSKSRVLEELNDEHDQLLLDWLINQKTTEHSEETDRSKGKNSLSLST